MRRLEAVRLIQWYHFQDEVLPIAGSCLFIGDNGCGKTTILDAIQVAVVGDLSEASPNKAANDKSSRSWYGYIRWKIGSEDESRPGAVRFGRGASTSFVILEFCDDVDAGSRFSCGICFEATETDSEIAKLHFVVPGIRAAEVQAVAAAGNGDGQKTVRPLRDFRTWLRGIGGRYWQDAGTYREELRQRLGVLPVSFHRLIVKALAFKPIGQVRQFVFDYLLDPHPIDTAALQSNLEHYKRLEGEAKEAEKRVVELEEIVREGERIRTEQRTADSHRYLEARADQEAARARLDSLDGSIAETRAMLSGLKIRSDKTREDLASLEREWGRAIGLLEGHETYRQFQDLERQLVDTERRLRDAESSDHEARALLAVQADALAILFAEEARALRRAKHELFERKDLLGAQEAPETIARLQSTLASEGLLTGRDLTTWQGQLDGATERARHVRLVLQTELNAAKTEGATLRDEQCALETGRQRYPDGPAALLHLLSSRLKGRREPRPLCELIEVPNARWRDAVEGYLNTRRFDVIVAAEDYPRALTLYEKFKRSYPLPGRGNVFIGGVGLVDIERIVRLVLRCEPRSLAQQVETTDPYARAYSDFVLGDVICVDDEQSLRNHRAAITDTVMVYRSHVARQTPREVLSRHYIGSAALRRRSDEIGSRLAELHAQVVALAERITWLDGAVSRLDRARTEVRRLPDFVARAEGLAGLRLQARRLAELKQRIDRSEFAALEQARDEITRSRQKLEEESRDLHKHMGKAEEKISQLSSELEEARTHAGRAESALQEFAALIDAPAREAYELRYAREREQRSPNEIHEVFERQRKGIETRVANLVLNLVKLKAGYVERHGFVAADEGAAYGGFVTELDAWRESHLPEYREKIGEAKTKALQQLAEDVVFRLRENLVLVKRQIDELNRALHDVPFGSEKYQFTVEVDPEHRDFYNLVMDAGRFEKESLFGAAALVAPELKATLGGLLDRLVEAEAKEVKTELEAKADYREYFRYDLKILHADGGYSLYDKVSGDKSGGETQTPYYIAILASMYRLYRGRSLDGRPSCGLVLLDEAFGKMDESRIAATLTFARTLGLQLVLATPKERSEMVAPAVERSLLIHKDPVGGMPTVLDFTKEFVRNGGEDAIRPGRTSHETTASTRT